MQIYKAKYAAIEKLLHVRTPDKRRILISPELMSHIFPLLDVLVSNEQQWTYNVDVIRLEKMTIA